MPLSLRLALCRTHASAAAEACAFGFSCMRLVPSPASVESAASLGIAVSLGCESILLNALSLPSLTAGPGFN